MGVSGNVRIGEVEAEGLGIVNDGHGEAVAVASAETRAEAGAAAGTESVRTSVDPMLLVSGCSSWACSTTRAGSGRHTTAVLLVLFPLPLLLPPSAAPANLFFSENAFEMRAAAAAAAGPSPQP